MSDKIVDWFYDRFAGDDAKKRKALNWAITADITLVALLAISFIISIFNPVGIAFVPFVIFSAIAFSYVSALTYFGALYEAPKVEIKWSDSPYAAFRGYWKQNKLMLFFGATAFLAFGASFTPGVGFWASLSVVAFGAVGYFVLLNKEHKLTFTATIAGMAFALVASGIGILPGGSIGLALALAYVVPFSNWAGLQLENEYAGNAASQQQQQSAASQQQQQSAASGPQTPPQMTPPDPLTTKEAKPGVNVELPVNVKSPVQSSSLLATLASWFDLS